MEAPTSWDAVQVWKSVCGSPTQTEVSVQTVLKICGDHFYFADNAEDWLLYLCYSPLGSNLIQRDVFIALVELMGPLEEFKTNVMELCSSSAFVGRVSEEDVSLLLLADGLEEGTYVMRLVTEFVPGSPMLWMHWVEGTQIKSTAVSKVSDGLRTTNYGNITFKNLGEVIGHQQAFVRAYSRPLCRLPYFHFSVSSYEAGTILQSAGPHRYLLRFSNSSPNSIVVTNTGQDNKVHNSLITFLPGGTRCVWKTQSYEHLNQVLKTSFFSRLASLPRNARTIPLEVVPPRAPLGYTTFTDSENSTPFSNSRVGTPSTNASGYSYVSNGNSSVSEPSSPSAPSSPFPNTHTFPSFTSPAPFPGLQPPVHQQQPQGRFSWVFLCGHLAPSEKNDNTPHIQIPQIVDHVEVSAQIIDIRMTKRCLFILQSNGLLLYQGQLRTQSGTKVSTYPVIFPLDIIPDKILKITTGPDTVAVLTYSGEVLVWGYFIDAAGGEKFYSVPLALPQKHAFVDMALASGDVLYVGPKIGSRVVAWEYSAMFLSTDGHIFSWGLNRSNMLCLGRTLSKSDSIIPVPFVGEFQEKRWRSISLSDSWGGAVDDDGYAYTWGYGWHGQDAQSIAWTPTRLRPSNPTARIESIHLCKDFGFILSNQGDVYSFGANKTGALGLGIAALSITPDRIDVSDSKFTKVVSNGSATLLLTRQTDRRHDMWSYFVSRETSLMSVHAAVTQLSRLIQHPLFSSGSTTPTTTGSTATPLLSQSSRGFGSGSPSFGSGSTTPSQNAYSTQSPRILERSGEGDSYDSYTYHSTEHSDSTSPSGFGATATTSLAGDFSDSNYTINYTSNTPDNLTAIPLFPATMSSERHGPASEYTTNYTSGAPTVYPPPSDNSSPASSSSAYVYTSIETSSQPIVTMSQGSVETIVSPYYGAQPAPAESPFPDSVGILPDVSSAYTYASTEGPEVDATANLPGTPTPAGYTDLTLLAKSLSVASIQPTRYQNIPSSFVDSSSQSSYSYHTDGSDRSQSYEVISESAPDTINFPEHASSFAPLSGASTPNSRRINNQSLSSSGDQSGGNSSARNWNEEFQQLLEAQTNTPLDKVRQQVAMRNFYGAFQEEARKIGMTIINDVGSANRTYQSLDVGGVAGGQKYIVNGIFFKFAIDEHNLYGGDEWARKSASLELKGMNSYLPYIDKYPGISFPMMFIMDYRGWRILATTCLPIGKGDIIYGSDDGGKSCHVDDPFTNEWMMQVGKELNLRPHQVVGNVTINAPADIEVHLSTDGRRYLLDTARVFPPEYPFAVMGVIQLGTTPLKETGFLARIDVDRRQLLELTSGMQLRKTNEGILYFQGLGDLNRAASLLAGEPIRGSAYILYGVEGRILYYQLRAEFVKKYKSPLSSDACSRFGMIDKDALNLEVKEATMFLRSAVLSQFAKDLDSKTITVSSPRQLVQTMHAAGINLRYLGMLRDLANEEYISKTILVEMITRVVKNFVKRRLRFHSSNHEDSSSFQTILAACFSLVLGNSPASSLYWQEVIKVQILAKYLGGCFKQNELSKEFDLRDSIDLGTLFQTLLSRLGVVLHDDVLDMYENDFDFFKREWPITEQVIVEVCPTVQVLQIGARSAIEYLTDFIGVPIQDMFPLDPEQYFQLTIQLSERVTQLEELFSSLPNEQITLHIYSGSQRSSFVTLENSLSLTKDHIVSAEYHITTALHKARIGSKKMDAHIYAFLCLSRGLISNAKRNLSEAELWYSMAYKAAFRVAGHAMVRATRYHLFFRKTFLKSCIPPILILLTNFMGGLMMDTDARWDTDCITYIHSLSWKQCPFPGDASAWKRVFRENRLPMFVLLNEWMERAREHKGSSLSSHLGLVRQAEELNCRRPLGTSHISSKSCRDWLAQTFSLNSLANVDVPASWLAFDDNKMLLPVRIYQAIRFELPTKIEVGEVVVPLELETRGTKMLITFHRNNMPFEGEHLAAETYHIDGDSERLFPMHRFDQPGQYQISINCDTNGPIDKFALAGSSSKLTVGAGEPTGYFIVQKHALPPLVAAQPTTWESSHPLHVHHSVRLPEIVVTRQGEALISNIADNDNKLIPIPALVGKKIVKVNRKSIICTSEPEAIARCTVTFASIALADTGEVYYWRGKEWHIDAVHSGSGVTPKLVNQLYSTPIRYVDCGLSFALALAADGTVYAWGHLEMVEMKLNKLLDYTCLSISLASVPPVALASAPDIIILPGNLRAVNIAAGYSHFVILAEDGSIHIYGQKFPSSSRSLIASGQEHYKLPIRWGHIEGIACGALHTIVLTSLGQVLCFGDNQKGQLGVGDTLGRSFDDCEPVSFTRLGTPTPKIVQVFANGVCSFALDDTNSVWKWGGTLLVPMKLNVPIPVRSVTPDMSGSFLHVSSEAPLLNAAHTFGVGGQGNNPHFAHIASGTMGDLDSLTAIPARPVSASELHKIAHILSVNHSPSSLHSERSPPRPQPNANDLTAAELLDMMQQTMRPVLGMLYEMDSRLTLLEKRVSGLEKTFECKDRTW